MENAKSRMKKSGTSLSTDTSMRLSSPPNSSPAKGRAYEDWGSSFPSRGSHKSRTTGGSSQDRASPIPLAESSDDEIDLFSSPNRSPPMPIKKPANQSSAAAALHPWEKGYQGPGIKSLKFKKNKPQGTNDTVDIPSNASSTTIRGSTSQESSQASSSHPQPLPRPTTRASVSQNSFIDLLASSDENGSKSKQSRISTRKPPPQRSKAPLHVHSPNGPVAPKPSRGISALSEDEDERDTPVKPSTRPRPKPAYKAKAPKSYPEMPSLSEADNDVKSSSTRKGKEKAGAHREPVVFLGSLSPVSGKKTPTKSGKGIEKVAKQFPCADLSPILRPPANVKGKCKQREDLPGFPSLSPLSEGKNSSSQAAFPPLSPLSSPVRTAKRSAARGARTIEVPWAADISPLAHADDMDTRVAPFPMSTQDLSSIKRGLTTPPRTGKRLSEGSDSEGSSRKRRRAGRDILNRHSLSLDLEDNSQVDIDSLFLDPSVDPSTLCPWCDEPLPAAPTPHLASLIASTKRKSYRDSRPWNALGLKAPLPVFIAVCQRHHFETHQIPLARAKGWPVDINFKNLRGRVEALKPMLEELIADGNTDWDQVETMDEDELGPRWKCEFWKEIVKEVKKKGSRAVVSVRGQFESFQKTQPGYYGELGSMIIQQTLYTLFPPASFDPQLIAPLTPTEFIQRILVPEVAVALIMEDMGLTKDNAMDTLRESVHYGVAMYPGDEDREGTEMGAGEEIVKERAMARRKELEEEERIEEEMMSTRRAEDASDSGLSVTNSKGKRKGQRERKKANNARMETDGEFNSEASESSAVHRRDPRRRRIVKEQSDQENNPMTSGEEKKPRRVLRPPKIKAVSKEQDDDTAAIGLSGGSDVEIADDAMSDTSTSNKHRRNAKSKTRVKKPLDSDIEVGPLTPRVARTHAIQDECDEIDLLSPDDEATPRLSKTITRPPNAGVASSSINASSGLRPLEAARQRSTSRAKNEQDAWLHSLRSPVSEDDGMYSDVHKPHESTSRAEHSWLLSDDSIQSSSSQ